MGVMDAVLGEVRDWGGLCGDRWVIHRKRWCEVAVVRSMRKRFAEIPEKMMRKGKNSPFFQTPARLFLYVLECRVKSFFFLRKCIL